MAGTFASAGQIYPTNPIYWSHHHDVLFFSPMESRRIRDFVSVPEHPTVVRLDTLFSEEMSWIEESYCITEDIGAHLTALKAAFSEPRGKGIFVIGQYGSGKSHLLAWVISKLSKHAFVPEGPDTAFISLVNFSATNRLEEIVCGALGIPCDGGDRRLAFAAVEEKKPNGLVLVLDEVSEFLRSKQDNRAFNEDVRFLQFLGEWAASRRFWIVGALQESIERTGDIEYEIYRKIKDRFPLRLILSPTHIRDLIAHGVLQKKNGYDTAVSEVIRKLEKATPRGIRVDSALMSTIYPLHPATLTLLEEVRDRFSSARGVIDFTVTRLRGDTERRVAPFLDRPFGELLTPEIIIDHYMDLLTIQPEFLPLSDKVFPYYAENRDRIFTIDAQKQLAERLLRLLSLVYLSRSRTGLTAAEAVYWLGFSAIQLTPEKNVKIVATVLDRLAGQGQYVKVSGGRYYLDTEENTTGAFTKLMSRELAQLGGESTATIIEEWAASLPENGVNPLTLPRNQWQARDVKWHSHNRRCFIYVGDDEPPSPPENGITLCIRLPFGRAKESLAHHSIVPATLQATDAIQETVAATRLLSKPIDKTISERAHTLLRTRIPESLKTLSTLYCRAERFIPRSRTASAPLLEIYDTTGGWLDENVRWTLGRVYSSFAQIAPTAGPLPLESYRAFIRFLREEDIASPSSNREVNLIREAYLVPMRLLKGTASGYRLPGNLTQHELVRLAEPLLENTAEPRALYKHLSGPVYGMVPDQIHLLLIFLYHQGEIDIIKNKRSMGELFETFPTPDKYDQIRKGGGLDPRHAADLTRLCTALNVKGATRGTVLSQREAAARAAIRCRDRIEPLTRLSMSLAEEADTEELARRIRRLVDWTRAFTDNDDPLMGFTQLMFETESILRYVDELETLGKLPDRIQRLVNERNRFIHLLSGVKIHNVKNGDVAVRLENLGPAPGFDAIESLEQWIEAAATAYAAYTQDYTAAHNRMQKSVAAHPAWHWTAPRLSQLRQADLGERLETCRKLRSDATQKQCRGISNLAFQPTCTCGFDGTVAPVVAILDALEAAQDEIDQTLVRLFSKTEVKQKVAAFAKERSEVTPPLKAYLDGKAPLPDITDLPALEKHMAGLKTVTEIEMTRLADALADKTWSREALFEEMARLIGPDSDIPVRFKASPGFPPSPQSAPSTNIVQWCVRQSLSSGTPLPAGFDDAVLLEATATVDASQISPKALAIVDRLGLPQETIRQLLTGLIEGRWESALPQPLSLLVDSVLKMVKNHAPSDIENFIEILHGAYEVTQTMRDVAPEPWFAYLKRLADWPGLQSLGDPAARLDSSDTAEWIIVDAMGLPLVPAIAKRLDVLLPDFRLIDTNYERWRAETTTKGCYDAMAKAGIQHRFHKIDCIDTLLHTRHILFDDLCNLIAAELEIAFKRVRKELDPRRPVLLFADHGCRLTHNGKGLTHGGDTLLEATIPVFSLEPRR